MEALGTSTSTMVLLVLGSAVLSAAFAYFVSTYQRYLSQTIRKESTKNDSDYFFRELMERNERNERRNAEALQRIMYELELIRSIQKRSEEQQMQQPLEVWRSARELDLVTKDLVQTLEYAHQIGSRLVPDSQANDVQQTEMVLSVYRQVSSEFTHGIKSPLQALEGAVSNLRDRLPVLLKGNNALSDEVKNTLVSSIDNAIAGIDQINVILEQGAGFIPGTVERFFVKSLVQKARRIVSGSIRGTPTLSLDLDTLPEMEYYTLNLLIAIVQLLENAYEAIDDNGQVTVKGQYDINMRQVKIQVTNDGTPIPPNDQHSIFADGYSTKGSSRGLGLGIARRCLERVGGTIELTHSDSSSTTFTILFTPNMVY